MTDMILDISLNMPIDVFMEAIEEKCDDDDIELIAVGLAKLCKKKDTIEVIRDFYTKVADIYTEFSLTEVPALTKKYQGRD